jgi:hypothetical protein
MTKSVFTFPISSAVVYAGLSAAIFASEALVTKTLSSPTYTIVTAIIFTFELFAG